MPYVHDSEPEREIFGRRKLGFASSGGHSVRAASPVISAIRAATRADLAVPAITCDTIERETFSSSAMAAGVVPFMRIDALISSGCTVLRSTQLVKFAVGIYCAELNYGYK